MRERRACPGSTLGCRVLAGSFVVGLVSSCAQPPRAADRGHEREASRHAAATAACLEAPPSTELIVDGSPCPWAGFRPSASEFAWQSLVSVEALAFRSELPEVCHRRTCELEARPSPWGPLLVLHVPSPESEMPSGAWLGIPQRGEIAFVDL